MKKAELQKIWKQLDGACEALEKLMEDGINPAEFFIDFSGIVALKNEVEEMIEKKTRK